MNRTKEKIDMISIQAHSTSVGIARSDTDATARAPRVTAPARVLTRGFTAALNTNY